MEKPLRKKTLRGSSGNGGGGGGEPKPASLSRRSGAFLTAGRQRVEDHRKTEGRRNTVLDPTNKRNYRVGKDRGRQRKNLGENADNKERGGTIIRSRYNQQEGWRGLDMKREQNNVEETERKRHLWSIS